MNEQRHWNKIADRYDEDIFDVFNSDRNGLLKKYFNKHANKKGTAIDFGCGNGRAFPYLSPRFREVTGADISENLLKDAAGLGYKNVNLFHRDLAATETNLPNADFIFSCNVIMLPNPEASIQMFRNVRLLMRKGAHALMVIPSTESMMFTAWTLTELYRKDGIHATDIDPDEFSYFSKNRSEIADGVFYIDGVPTRHYTAPQLEAITASVNLKITSLERLEYNWDSELADPPKDLKAPYPWDWLMECKRKS
ncbi:MAG: class I SAM-dependent DNA methyltransferase [Bacteroidota bacterium]